MYSTSKCRPLRLKTWQILSLCQSRQRIIKRTRRSQIRYQKTSDKTFWRWRRTLEMRTVEMQKKLVSTSQTPDLLVDAVHGLSIGFSENQMKSWHQWRLAFNLKSQHGISRIPVPVPDFKGKVAKHAIPRTRYVQARLSRKWPSTLIHNNARGFSGVGSNYFLGPTIRCKMQC